MQSVASGESGPERTTSDDVETERPKTMYEQNLSINDRKMKLQCQLVDVLTGQGATVTDAATLMTAAAKVSSSIGFIQFANFGMSYFVLKPPNRWKSSKQILWKPLFRTFLEA